MSGKRFYLFIVFITIVNILASKPLSELNLSEILKGGYNYIATIGENHTFYVADRTKQRIYIIDFSGKVLKSFGRKGEGPGEFRFINELLFAEDKLYVQDSGVFIHVFDRNGNYLKLIRSQGFLINEFRVLKDRIFASVHEYKVEGRKVKVLDAIYLINEEGKVIRKIENNSWIHREIQVKKLPGKNFVSSGWTHPYYPDLKMEKIKNQLVYCWTASNKLYFSDPAGESVRSIEVKALAPEKLNKAEIEYFRKLIKKDPSMFIPEKKASFYDFFYDRVRKVVVFVLPPSVVEAQNGYPSSYEVVLTDLNFKPIKKLKIKIKRRGWGKVVGVYDGKILLIEPDSETDQIFLRFIDINLPQK